MCKVMLRRWRDLICVAGFQKAATFATISSLASPELSP